MPRQPTRIRLITSCLLGVIAAVGTGLVAPVVLGGVVGWICLAFTYTGWTWVSLRRLSPAQVRDLSTTEEPGRRISHGALVLASLASLVGVGLLLVAGSGASSAVVPLEALVGTTAVAASWLLVHMIFTAHYASLYYADEASRPVDFDGDDPDYQDFAYLAFTLGMTYQVSDTTLATKAMRRAALRHAMLSYLFGAVVIASAINLVAQLASANVGP